MKKTYISPSLSMVHVELVSMIAGSPTLNQNNENPNVDVNHEEYNGKFGSRRTDIWADEEEEEY